MRLVAVGPRLSWTETGAADVHARPRTAAAPRRSVWPTRSRTDSTPRRSLTPEDAGSARLALARIAFLVRGRPAPDVVRDTILASWTRSRLWHVPVDHLDVPFDADLDSESALLRAARPVLAEAAEQLASEPVSVILSDADGVVLTRAPVTRAWRRAWTGSGSPPASATRRSTSAPTASAPRWRAAARPEVFGHEHYVEHLEEFACTGRAGAAPGHAQGARRHRPHVLAPRRRAVHDGRRRVGVGPAHRERCCWSTPGAASTRCCTTT